MDPERDAARFIMSESGIVAIAKGLEITEPV